METRIDPAVSGNDAYGALADLISALNPYGIPSNVRMPVLTGTPEQLKSRGVLLSGWLRDRIASLAAGNFSDSPDNLAQVCNNQMTLSDKQQSFYWTVLVPTGQDVPACPHGCRDRNEPGGGTEGAEMKTYQVCKAIFVPIQYDQAGQNGPDVDAGDGNGPQPTRQTLEGGILIGFVGSGGH